MKKNIIYLGVLLILGLFILSPVSATKLVDKNTHTTYSTKYDCSGVISYSTYKFNTKKIKTIIKVRYVNGKHGTLVLDLLKVSSKKIKLVSTSRTDWGNKKTINYIKTRWSVSKYYTLSMKPYLRAL